MINDIQEQTRVLNSMIQRNCKPCEVAAQQRYVDNLIKDENDKERRHRKEKLKPFSNACENTLNWMARTESKRPPDQAPSLRGRDLEQYTAGMAVSTSNTPTVP